MLILVFALSALQINSLQAQTVFNLGQGAIVYAGTSSVVRVQGSLNLENSSTFSLGAGDVNLLLSGLDNNGNIDLSNRSITFTGDYNGSITGSVSTTFGSLYLDKQILSANRLDIDANFFVLSNLHIIDGILRFTNNQSSTISVESDVIVDAAGTFDVSSIGTESHLIQLDGNLQNNGSIDFNVAGSLVELEFRGTSNSEIYGIGVSYEFGNLNINKQNSASVTLLSLLSNSTQFLELSNGYFVIAGVYSFSNPLFTPSAGFYDIPANTGLIINNPNVSITGQNASMRLVGDLQLLQGEYFIGEAGNQTSLFYQSGSRFRLDDGSLNIRRNFARITSDDNANINFALNGGVINLGLDKPNVLDRAVFDIGSTSSTFSQTGGNLNIIHTSDNFSSDYLVLATTATATGGTLFFNPEVNDDNETEFRYNATAPSYNVNVLDNVGAANPRLELVSNSATINGNLNFRGRGFLSNNLNHSIGGDFINNANNATDYVQGTARLTLIGAGDQELRGNNSTTFSRLWVNKTGGEVSIAYPVAINTELRLISNTIFDIGQHDLYMGVNAGIFADSINTDTDPNSDPFGPDKFIRTRGLDSTDGRLYRFLPNISPLSSITNVRFPVGTDANYTPFRFQFRPGFAYWGNNAWISCIPIKEQHPDFESENVALAKYWKINTNAVTIDEGGYSIRVQYSDAEVQGDETTYNYGLLRQNGNWYVNPSANDGYGVEIINNIFTVDQINIINMRGDWTVGPAASVERRYYSLGGDWEEAASWSRVGYGGPPSPTPPSSNLDVIYIGDNKIIDLNTVPGNFRAIYVENTGTLNFPNEVYVQGDSIRVFAGGTIGIGSVDGISADDAVGNVRTTFAREFSEEGIYVYNGTESNQFTGTGLPNLVRSLHLNKNVESFRTLTLSKSVEIGDSLVIYNGLFDLNGFTINGASPGRTMIMYDGIIRMEEFPSNYAAPTFSAGTIEFVGENSVTIPSSIANFAPAVAQYYNLKISGNRDANTYITLDPTGEIRIANEFDVSDLTFNTTPNAERFVASGSTVVFNGNVSQAINCGYDSPTSINFRPYFHNLVISGSAEKTVGDPNDNDPNNNFLQIRNTFTQNSATFNTNGHDLRVFGNWEINGGVFEPNEDKVVFILDGTTNSITSNGRSFYDIDVIDNSISGKLIINDNLSVENNFNLQVARLETTSSTISIGQDFTQNGILDLSNGWILFNGVGDQTFTMESAQTIPRLEVNKTSGDVKIFGDENVIISNTLLLSQGNIGGRQSGRVVRVDGSIVRPGATPGHIDGPLRLFIPINNPSITYPIGLNNDYTPLTLNFTGTGGGSGYLDAATDYDFSATATYPAPNVDATVLETDFPNGAALDQTLNVRRYWSLNASDIPGNLFQLASSRNYEAIFNYVSSDLRGSANPLNFEISQRNGNTNTGNWFKAPTGTRTSTSAATVANTQLPNDRPVYFYVGEPVVFTFYSIANGNWNDVNTWSTAGYGGQVATRTPEPIDNVRIGDDKTVTLNTGHNVNANRSVIVDSSGRLDLTTNVIGNGTGSNSTFLVRRFGAIGVGSSDGITTSGATGNIQTTNRFYNGTAPDANHNRTHVIYNGTGNQNTGNGLPTTTQSLVINKPSGTLAFNTAGSPPIHQIIDSVGFINGTTNISNIILKVGGDFVHSNSATFIPGTRWLDGNLGSAENNLRDSTSWESGVRFNGSGVQRIRGTYDDSVGPLTFQRFTMGKPSGEVISHFNLEVPVFFLSIANRTNLNMAEFDKSLTIYNRVNTSQYVFGRLDFYNTTEAINSLPNQLYGYIIGRLVRYFNVDENERFFPIGTGFNYSPLRIDRLASRGGAATGQVAGMIEAQAKEGNHPDFVNSQINPNTNIQRYWEITRPVGITPQMTQGDRPLAIEMIFTDNEPRGGVDPVTYSAFRLQSDGNWTNSANISTTIVSSTRLRAITNLPTLGGNNIFQYPSVDNPSNNALVLMIGKAPNPSDRVFYSRQSGNWTDVNTWSSENHNSSSNTYSDYPRYIDDIVFIAGTSTGGHKVSLDVDGVITSSVTIDTLGGNWGTLEIPGERKIYTRQFIHKNGSQFDFGSQYGLIAQPNQNVSTYTFSESITAYSAISGGTVLVSAGGNTDAVYNNINLGFGFVYNGVVYDQVAVCEEGYLSFNNSMTRSAIPISTTDATRINIISALGFNLQGQTGSNIRYETIGTAPNRTFVVQWLGYRPVSDNNGDNYNFQIRLNEGTNIVDLHYGSFATSSATNKTPQVGLKGHDNTNYLNRNKTTTNNWSGNTSNGTLNTQTVVLRSGGLPNTGLRFRYTPPAITAQPDCNIAARIIRNFDFLDSTKNRYTFIGGAGQVSGSSFPSGASYIEVNKTAGTNATFTNSIIVKDTLKLTSGNLVLANVLEPISLRGDLINNSAANAIQVQSGTSRFSFTNLSDQRIFGNVQTSFPSPVWINKTGGRVILPTASPDVRFVGDLHFETETLFEIQDNRNLIMAANANFTSSTGAFNENRMVLVHGGASTGQVIKEYTTGTNLSSSFTVPFGEDSLGLGTRVYSDAILALNNMDFAANSRVTFQLRKQYPHPNAVIAEPNMLKKWWSLSSENISLRTSPQSTMDASFRYINSERVGNIVNYRPAAYRRAPSGAEGWSFRIDDASLLDIDTTNRFILIEGAKRLPDHDWTAGDPSSFQQGRRFWSIATGNWREPSSWTNDAVNTHNSSITALNSPGYFPNDTVFIDNGNVITFSDTPLNGIDSLGIGISGPSTGQLQFAHTAENHRLEVLNSVTIDNTGSIIKQAGAGDNVDTLRIWKNLTNDGTFNTHFVRDRTLLVDFVSANNSIISGEGTYTSLGPLRMRKDGNLDTLINQSVNFSNAITAVSDAAALEAPPRRVIDLDFGVYRHSNSAEIKLSSDDTGELLLGANVGIVVEDGIVRFEDGLIAGQNSSLYMVGGDVYVGNAFDENLSYESITIVEANGNSSLYIAGNYKRRYINSRTDFRIRDNALVEVMREGALTNTASDLRRGGFDLGSTESTFLMTGGTIRLVRPMTVNSSLKDPDYINNTSSSTITGGTVEIGDGSLDPGAVPAFSINASVPFWNLNLVNTYSQTLTLANEQTTINNDFTIRNQSTASLNGNNINIGGDFSILGSNGRFLMGTSGNRRVFFTGSGNQTFRNENNTSDNFFTVGIEKSSGTLTLDNTDFSNLVARNAFIFGQNNTGIVDARTNNKYVQLGTSSTDGSSLSQFGSGWVNGEFRLWINNGLSTKIFPVGSATNYTPATLEFTSGSGTQGLLSVNAIPGSPEDIPDVLTINPDTYVLRYWKIVPVASAPFALGVGRTYSLLTRWVKGQSPSGDLRNGATFGIFEHFRRTPAQAGGTWNTVSPDSRTDSTTRSRLLTQFGDFMVGEPAGETFYSIADGEWNSPSTWSKEGYSGIAETVDIPDQVGDVVRIGNNRHVTLQSSSPRIRNIIVEKVLAGPGRLTILDERHISGLAFQLGDSCLLATDDPYGYTSLTGTSPNVGAVRTTNARIYGRSVYMYIANINQATGDGLPNNVKTILIDNPGLVGNTVSLSRSGITVDDTLAVNRGRLGMQNRELNVAGQVVMNNTTAVVPGTGTFRFTGGNTNNVLLNNTNGMNVSRLEVNKTGGQVLIGGSNANSNILVNDTLRFATSNTALINTRTNNKRVDLAAAARAVRQGSGHVDGTLRRNVTLGSGSQSFFFPIGNGSTYAGATVEWGEGTGGTSGAIDGIVQTPVASEELLGNRLQQNMLINRYWSLRPVNSLTLGDRQPNVRLEFPSSELSNIDQPNAVVRRQSFPTTQPEWTERRGTDLLWNLGTTTVEIAPSSNSWTGLGDFYIGNKAQRVFYAINSGDWTSSTVWAFDAAGTQPVPNGLFPNPDWNFTDEAEVRDSVFIQSGRTVNLNIQPELAYLNIQDGGNLVINDSRYISQSSVGTSIFEQTGLMDIKSDYPISSDLNTSLIRFDNITFNNQSDFAYSGTTTQTMGNNFPATIDNLTISNTGDDGSNFIILKPGNLNINGDFELTNGDLRANDDTSVLSFAGNLDLGVSLNLTQATNGDPACTELVFANTNPSSSTITGPGGLLACDIRMNNSTGGIVNNTSVTVTGVFDFGTTGNNNNQFFDLSGGSLFISNPDPNALLDYNPSGPQRFFLTGTSGLDGCLSLNINPSNTYTYPIGSLELGNHYYAPAIYGAGATGDAGYMCVATSSGTNNTIAPRGHLWLSAATINYITRYWSVKNITTSIAGQMRYEFNEFDEVSELGINYVGRWAEPNESNAGYWFKYANIKDIPNRYFATLPNWDTSDLFGDWTVANEEAFSRFFYSRQSGLLTDNLTWSGTGHTGSAYPVGVVPTFNTDSIIIGGGVQGVSNHIVDLNVSATISGMALGTGPNNTGTLITGDNTIYGNGFTLGEGSTLSIAGDDGIAAEGDNYGPIQTINRSYDPGGAGANFIYNGSNNQNTGSGLPSNLGALTIDNTGGNGNNTVTLLNGFNASSTLTINDGVFDIASNTITLNSDLVINENGSNAPCNGVVAFSGTTTKTIFLDNEDGISVSGFSIGAHDLLGIKGNNAGDNTNINICNLLTFNGDGRIQVRNSGILVSMANAASVVRSGSNTFGFVDGTMRYDMGTGSESRTYTLGNGTSYYPLVIDLSAGTGTGGFVGAIVNTPIDSEPYTGNRLDPNASVNYFWNVANSTGSLFAFGDRQLRTRHGITQADEDNLNVNNVAIRRQSLSSETPEYTERRGDDLVYSAANNVFTMTGSSSPWAAFGNFYIGEKAKRVFYTIGSGLWDNNTIWAFDEAGTILAPSGVYPNNDWNDVSGNEAEVRDSVIIRNTHSITLNTQPELAYLELQEGGALILNPNTYISQSSIGLSSSTFGAGLLDIKSDLGINADTTNSLFRFEDINFGNNTNFAYSGSFNQQFGTGFPENIGSLTIDNQGIDGNNAVAMTGGQLNVSGTITLNDGLLKPLSTTTAINLAGDLINSSTFDFTNDIDDNPVNTLFTFNGSGNTSQTISGNGLLTLYDVAMDRGAGTGIVESFASMTVTNQFDFLTGANPNPQYFKIGDDASVYIENCDETSIADYSATRFFVNDLTSGLLLRNICTDNTYIFPVGSVYQSDYLYAPATYIAGNSGDAGYIGIRTSPGSDQTFLLAHDGVSGQTTDYLRRHWTVDEITTTINGQMRFDYNEDDISGNDNNFTSIGQWLNVFEQNPGSWNKYPSGLFPASNYFQTSTNFDISNLRGDWTAANIEAFIRIFYSRQSGTWNDYLTWTDSPTHSGAVWGIGVYPTSLGDSVVVAGFGGNNHRVELNNSATVTGTQLGNGVLNGTLVLNADLYGERFYMQAGSELVITSAQGIAQFPADLGSVRTNVSRSFSEGGIYNYSSTINQITGSGLPANVGSLIVNNTGEIGSNSVTLTNNVSVANEFRIDNGIADLQTRTANSGGSGTFNLAAGATLRLSGTNSLLDALNNYGNYTIATTGVTDFYGGEQIISDLPVNLTAGLGTVTLRNIGDKIVSNPLYIRGTLSILENSTLVNQVGVNSLHVVGGVLNSSSMNNDGRIRVGSPE